MNKGQVTSIGTEGDDLWFPGRMFVFRISTGWHLRPYSCRGHNPWKCTGSKVWEGGRVTRPFFSVHIGHWGFYIGWKIYELDPKDDIWLGTLSYPYGQYLCLSMRSSRSVKNG